MTSGHNCAPTVASCTTAVEVQQADAWLQSTLPHDSGEREFYGERAAGGDLRRERERQHERRRAGGNRAAGDECEGGLSGDGDCTSTRVCFRLMLEAQGVSALPDGGGGAEHGRGVEVEGRFQGFKVSRFQCKSKGKGNARVTASFFVPHIRQQRAVVGHPPLFSCSFATPRRSRSRGRGRGRGGSRRHAGRRRSGFRRGRSRGPRFRKS